jgi:signal peptidase I
MHSEETKKTNPIVDFLQSIVISIAICTVLYTFLISPLKVQGSSMEPNFFEGDNILTDKVTQWVGETTIGQSIDVDYKRGDIIAIDIPNQKYVLKRIIALEGETVEILNGYVYINGQKLDESGYLASNITTKGANFINDGEIKTVPAHSYFAMGDNRGVSYDSRYFGFINRDWIKGKVILKY